MSTPISDKDIQEFTSRAWRYYKKFGRHDLAWRKKTDPYSITVSEVMLQQTQVTRVEEYFKKWMKEFPTIKKLSQSELSDVLKQWQGLGYNRRGKYLHDIAKKIMNDFGGVFPEESEHLRSLPGVGSYTQAAIEAFSYNKRSILVETNIRTAVIYHFFKNKETVTEKEIEHVLECCYKKGTKAYKNPREWNWALMDYGSHLKKEVGNLNKKSKTYTKQSRFEGSTRQLRSGILRYILSKGVVSALEIEKASANRKKEVAGLLIELQKEGMIQETSRGWRVV